MFLLASDYDNTLKVKGLKGYDLRINIPYLRKFISDGNVFLLNTGRPYKSIKEEIDKYNIPFSYLGCNDGNIMFDSGNNIIYSSNLNSNLYYDLFPLEEKFNLKINIVKYEENILEFELIISNLSNEFFNELEKIMVKYNLCKQVFEKKGFYQVYVYSKEINKSTPIEYLKDKHGILHENIYTVGDHYNDLEMISSYNGYAMWWAKQGVKDVAQGTCPSVASLVKRIEKRR